MVETTQIANVQPTRENLSGLAQRPRVVWDMTFTVRTLTGTRVYTHNLLNAIRALDRFEVREIYGTREAGPRRRGNFKSNVQNLVWLWAGLERELKRQQPALFHAAAFLGAWRAPCPMLVNVFDTTYLTYPHHFDWKWHFYARTIMPRSIQNAAAILTLSQHARGEICNAYRVAPERVHIVAPGIGAEFQPIQNAEALAALRAKYELPRNYLLYVGGTPPRKNLPTLIAAFARARRQREDLMLVLAGARMLTDAPVERAIADCGVAPYVIRLGYVPQTDLPLLYGGAQAFVYASMLEGFGIPPVEAMACGTPVISVPNPPMPEVLGDAAWFTENDSPEALGAGIVHVVSDDALQNTLRQCGIERARLYSWDASARKTIALYENVLAYAPRADSTL